MKTKTITQEQYLTIKQEALTSHNEFLASHGHLPIDDLKLTCDDCKYRFTCEYAGDFYNTDGDCLAAK